MDRIIPMTFDYKKQNNILAAKALYIAEEIAFRSSLILSASEFLVILLFSHATKRPQGKLATKSALAAALGPLACLAAALDPHLVA